MTALYQNSSEKNLWIGFASVFSAFAVFSGVLFRVEHISENVALGGFIVAIVLSCIGLIFLHRETFGRQY